MVPIAIADTIGTSIDTVTRIIRSEGLEIPSYLTTTGPKDRRPRCTNCRQRIV
jgi:hypothetical protein